MQVDTTRSPLRTLAAWIDEARALGVKDPDAMALATATRDAFPSARMVLCRGIDDDGVRFFTSYESRKGRELEANPRAAAVFHWREMGKQVKVEGGVSRVAASVSDAYFASRPRGNRIAACVSPQSQPIDGIESLRERFAALEAELGEGDVPRPSHWGGYEIRATAVELWEASPVRLHECIRYERQGQGWVASWRGP